MFDGVFFFSKQRTDNKFAILNGVQTLCFPNLNKKKKTATDFVYESKSIFQPTFPTGKRFSLTLHIYSRHHMC